jgi:hypothetical protein
MEKRTNGYTCGNRHAHRRAPRTRAKKTTTPEQATPRPAATVAQVLAAQQAPVSAAPPPAPVKEILPALTGTTSREAFNRHIADWSGNSMQALMVGFNGNTGIYSVMSDGTEIPPGSEFVAAVDQLRKGWIKFNDGAPRDTVMIGIAEDGELPARDELGDNDPAKWGPGLDGRPRDPWQPQYLLPLQSRNEGGELFIFVARSVTAMNTVEGLLNRVRLHPKARAGMLPVIKLMSGSFQNKKFNKIQPKPLLPITGWVNADGTPAESPGAPKLKAAPDDEIAF